MVYRGNLMQAVLKKVKCIIARSAELKLSSWNGQNGMLRKICRKLRERLMAEIKPDVKMSRAERKRFKYSKLNVGVQEKSKQKKTRGAKK